MKRTALLLAVVAGCATSKATSYQPLFDGSAPDGWVQAGPGRMVIEDGVARTEGGMGLWYYEKKRFKDFVLQLQWKQLQRNANAGVFVRFPRVNGDPWVPVKEGYEIQIAGTNVGDKHSTGSVYSFKAPDVPVPVRENDWNDYQIEVIGQQYRISINGRLVNTFTGDRATEGMIGLQNHGDKDAVVFRNVRIREL